jgi:hypothetical protein
VDEGNVDFTVFVGLVDLAAANGQATAEPASVANGVFFDLVPSGPNIGLEWRANVAANGTTTTALRAAPADYLRQDGQFQALRIVCSEDAVGQRRFARFYVDKRNAENDMEREYVEIQFPTGGAQFPTVPLALAVGVARGSQTIGPVSLYVDFCSFTAMTTKERP